MRILNFHARKFAIGRKVMLIKDFQSGSIQLLKGATGTIVSSHTESFPDLGLFDLRILDIDFVYHRISIGEGVADTYMKQI